MILRQGDGKIDDSAASPAQNEEIAMLFFGLLPERRESERNMKRILLILLTMLLCVSLLAACGDKDNKNPTGDVNVPGDTTASGEQTEEYETLYYSYYTYRMLDDGTAEILHYYGMEEVVEIPA